MTLIHHLTFAPHMQTYRPHYPSPQRHSRRVQSCSTCLTIIIFVGLAIIWKSLAPAPAHINSATAVTRQKSDESDDVRREVDFALSSSGASIIPSLTSRTFWIGPSGLWETFVATLTFQGNALGLPPTTVLNDNSQNGQCWPLEGQAGQIGISLPTPVKVEEIAISHIPPFQTWNIEAAPKDFQVWGLVENSDDHHNVIAWESSRSEVGCEVPQPPQSLTQGNNRKYFRLVNSTYDINIGKAKQNFLVEDFSRRLQMSYREIVVIISSNHGAKEFTCMYHVGVMGRYVIKPFLGRSKAYASCQGISPVRSRVQSRIG